MAVEGGSANTSKQGASKKQARSEAKDKGEARRESGNLLNINISKKKDFSEAPKRSVQRVVLLRKRPRDVKQLALQPSLTASGAGKGLHLPSRPVEGMGQGEERVLHKASAAEKELFLH